MLIGYGRVATGEDPVDQVEALTRAGVAAREIHIDTLSGARAARPELELVLARARGGDILVVTRLERLAGSVSRLVSLGARLCERGVGLRVLAQDIDTATAQGRAKLPMRCPSCGNEPTAARERVRHRQDLAMTWLYPDPHHPGRVLQRRHCAACQPHQQVASIECALCADGPMLAGQLAQPNADADPVQTWLTTHGWQNRPRLGLVCARHPVSLATVEGAGSASSDSDDHDRQGEASEVG